MEVDYRSRDLRVVGNHIEADGYVVATISDKIPPTIRQRFENAIDRLRRVAGE